MPQREELFYNAYSYGDKLEPGQKMTLEHHISFNPYRADLSSLTEMTLGNLQVMREKSVAEERKIFSELQERAQLWEAQAAQTMVLEKAMEYVKTPEVKNSGNRWEDTEYGWRRISNRVYQMTYRIREDTAYDHKLKSRSRWRGMCPGAWNITSHPGRTPITADRPRWPGRTTNAMRISRRRSGMCRGALRLMRICLGNCRRRCRKIMCTCSR